METGKQKAGFTGFENFIIFISYLVIAFISDGISVGMQTVPPEIHYSHWASILEGFIQTCIVNLLPFGISLGLYHAIQSVRKKGKSITLYISLLLVITIGSWIAFSIVLKVDRGKSQDENERIEGTDSLTSESYKYNLIGCEYSVIFYEEPNVSESETESTTFEMAELENAHRYLRSESLIYKDTSLIESIDKGYIFSVLEQYADYEGLENPGYTYAETKSGKHAQLIGYKIVQKGGATQVTKFVIRAYYGTKSAIFLYAMCPSGDWPTEEVRGFLSSIERN